MSLFQQTLQKGLAAVACSLPEAVLSDQEAFYEFLVEENKTKNLTAIVSPEEAAFKHFLDSLAPLWLELLPQGCSMIDVGAGAGFPSLPLKIARPDIQLTMLDSARKRTDFLTAAAVKLSLQHCRIIWSRAEDSARLSDFRAQFDIAVARAVASMPVLLEYLLPFVKPGGACLLYKGPSARQEADSSARALKILGGKIDGILPCGIQSMEHYIVVVQKTHPTPAGYPRKSGTPAKSPL